MKIKVNRSVYSLCKYMVYWRNSCNCFNRGIRWR